MTTTNRSRAILFFILTFIAGLIVGASGLYYLEKNANYASVDATLVMAHQAYSQRDYDTVLELLYVAAVRQPERYSPYVMMGDAYVQLGRRDAALKMYNTALKNTHKKQRSAILENLDARIVDYDRKIIEKKIVDLDVRIKETRVRRIR